MQASIWWSSREKKRENNRERSSVSARDRETEIKTKKERQERVSEEGREGYNTITETIGIKGCQWPTPSGISSNAGALLI